jgi:hypothetical protein
MKNKAHFVKKLCALRNWTDPESPEVTALYKLSVVDLLIAIKQETPVPSISEDDEDLSLAERLGCIRD